jgi:hypothetical protein
MTNNSQTQAQAIVRLNDMFRTTLQSGTVILTEEIRVFSEEEQAVILAAVQNFWAFTADNDPHEEHDFGNFLFNNTQILFKIDYYDLNMEFLSENPADPNLTRRVLTIMLAEEY